MDNCTEIVSVLDMSDNGQAFSSVLYADGVIEPPPMSFLLSFSSLILPISGVYRVGLSKNMEQKIVDLIPGQVLMVPSNCWYYPTWNTASKVLTILFGKKQTGFSLVETVPAKSRKGEPAISTLKHHIPAVFGVQARMIDTIMELHEKCPGCEVHLVKALLLYIRQSLFESTPHPHGKSKQLFESACIAVQENFHRPITRKSLAEEFGVTPCHLSRIFQQNGMMKFLEYLTWVRIERAKFLLVNHNMQVKELALSCGYDDVSYFCRIFRRKMKSTPEQYRIAMRKSRSLKSCPVSQLAGQEKRG